MASSFLWGTMELNVLHGSYRPPHVSSNGLTEIDILPDPLATSPITVLQQAGRKRKMIAFDAYVTEWTEYNTLLNDFMGATEKTFTGVDSVSLTMIIYELGEPEYVLTGLIKFSMVFMEA